MRWEPVAHPEDDLFWGDKLLLVPHVPSQPLCLSGGGAEGLCSLQ